MRTITLVTLALLLLCSLPTSVAQAQVPLVAPVNPTPIHQATPAPETGRTLIAWLDQPATLRAGQWAIFTGTPGPFGVQFREMVSDTRCPAGVMCAQAGQVVIRLAFQLGGESLPDEVELGTYTNDGQNKAIYQGYEIDSWTSCHRGPRQTKRSHRRSTGPPCWCTQPAPQSLPKRRPPPNQLLSPRRKQHRSAALASR